MPANQVRSTSRPCRRRSKDSTHCPLRERRRGRGSPFRWSSNGPAVTRGFGAVYTDVDQDQTHFTYFDTAGNPLGQFPVPIADRSLSFLGVFFNKPEVARVRIEYGTVALGPDDSPTNNVAVMDDLSEAWS